MIPLFNLISFYDDQYSKIYDNVTHLEVSFQVSFFGDTALFLSLQLLLAEEALLLLRVRRHIWLNVWKKKLKTRTESAYLAECLNTQWKERETII